MLKFFWPCSIFFEYVKFFWPRLKVIFYLINFHIWAWSKIFEHIQKILNTVKNIWTWSKNIWTSKWIRHQWILDFGFFEAKIAEYKISYGISHIHSKSCWLTQERLEEDPFSTFFLVCLRSRSTAAHTLLKRLLKNCNYSKSRIRPLRLKNTALQLSYGL